MCSLYKRTLLVSVVCKRSTSFLRNFDGAICVLFEGTVLAGIGRTAEPIGLMVITLERYFKIVHAIGHRKYYRNWMTKVGVALPWIGALPLQLFTGIGTTKIVNGRCLRFGVWINQPMKQVSLPVRIFYAILPSYYNKSAFLQN